MLYMAFYVPAPFIASDTTITYVRIILTSWQYLVIANQGLQLYSAANVHMYVCIPRFFLQITIAITYVILA